ncbi:MAG TPA: SDR family NAD(P)-dependent oxidoreductase [Chitinophagaceae bacterium]|jgi:NAD(P)-dependent dehydrogenase (short-subunit alcohol dehydrogenase family)|nr:SDR family NAD(P)-dependent oxidoreductase [Chitinophagaceae bacterium]
MARIFITGSANGLGQLAARSLMKQGHKVVLHARNSGRAREAIKKNPEAESCLIGDLSNPEETKELAREVNKLGAFDAVIHNAGVYRASAQDIFAVNTLAPYMLTCLLQKPKRVIYLTSGMHSHGHLNPDNFRKDSTHITYSDSKLHVLMLCMAVARKWKDVYSNAVNPGWVPTKMGGPGAPDNLQKGYETQVWLAVSNDEQVKVSGHYFFHQQEKHHNPEADDILLQERFLDLCKEITGISFPG